MQQLQVVQEAEAGHETMAAQPSMTSFAPFPKLPAQIRIRIWELAVSDPRKIPSAVVFYLNLDTQPSSILPLISEYQAFHVTANKKRPRLTPYHDLSTFLPRDSGMAEGPVMSLLHTTLGAPPGKSFNSIGSPPFHGKGRTVEPRDVLLFGFKEKAQSTTRMPEQSAKPILTGSRGQKHVTGSISGGGRESGFYLILTDILHVAFPACRLQRELCRSRTRLGFDSDFPPAKGWMENFSGSKSRYFLLDHLEINAAIEEDIVLSEPEELPVRNFIIWDAEKKTIRPAMPREIEVKVESWLKEQIFGRQHSPTIQTFVMGIECLLRLDGIECPQFDVTCRYRNYIQGGSACKLVGRTRTDGAWRYSGKGTIVVCALLLPPSTRAPKLPS